MCKTYTLPMILHALKNSEDTGSLANLIRAVSYCVRELVSVFVREREEDKERERVHLPTYAVMPLYLTGQHICMFIERRFLRE